MLPFFFRRTSNSDRTSHILQLTTTNDINSSACSTAMGNNVILEPLIVIGNADGTAAGLRGKIPLGDAHSDDEDDDESKSQRKSLCQKRVAKEGCWDQTSNVFWCFLWASAWKRRIISVGYLPLFLFTWRIVWKLRWQSWSCIQLFIIDCIKLYCIVLHFITQKHVGLCCIVSC